MRSTPFSVSSVAGLSPPFPDRRCRSYPNSPVLVQFVFIFPHPCRLPSKPISVIWHGVWCITTEQLVCVCLTAFICLYLNHPSSLNSLRFSIAPSFLLPHFQRSALSCLPNRFPSCSLFGCQSRSLFWSHRWSVSAEIKNTQNWDEIKQMWLHRGQIFRRDCGSKKNLINLCSLDEYLQTGWIDCHDQRKLNFCVLGKITGLRGSNLDWHDLFF